MQNLFKYLEIRMYRLFHSTFSLVLIVVKITKWNEKLGTIKKIMSLCFYMIVPEHDLV